MRISSLRSSSLASVSPTAIRHSRSSSGIASTPSSINMRLQAAESSGGFCSCVRDIIDRICRFLGLSSTQTTRAVTHGSFQDRVTRGKEILSNHFRRWCILRDDGQHSAIAVIINHNGRSVVTYGSAESQKNGLELIKDRLENLISQDTPAPANSELQISTVYFKKVGNTYTCRSFCDKIPYLNHVPAPTGTVDTVAAALDFETMSRNIDFWNCPPAKKDEIKLFLARI